MCKDNTNVANSKELRNFTSIKLQSKVVSQPGSPHRHRFGLETI
jgi:hypothetical protein